ncbi:dopamine beta-hydroxylase [Elysia marginata]|uniref:Dopamine beta-hydroxylase n=1 Tax=Elysia marginata TaxID=1093978 RepID=A0AAV4JEP7_9GAST|nr:dopamine beta-hydroxylase [Elysia marginata]
MTQFLIIFLSQSTVVSVSGSLAIRTIDLRFPSTPIPPTETNYYCMTFNLPSDQDYHIVANEGIIDNANVLHHQLLYACEGG